MRVVIVGAAGNVGTALLRRLHDDPDVSLAGIARRLPDPEGVYAGVDWHAIDIGDPAAAEPLAEVFDGADAVVHLGWQIQPSHDRRRLYRTNVLGSRSVARCVRAYPPWSMPRRWASTLPGRSGSSCGRTIRAPG
jgi:UDP-glucose 4-epimerase